MDWSLYFSLRGRRGIVWHKWTSSRRGRCERNQCVMSGRLKNQHMMRFILIWLAAVGTGILAKTWCTGCTSDKKAQWSFWFCILGIFAAEATAESSAVIQTLNHKVASLSFLWKRRILVAKEKIF